MTFPIVGNLKTFDIIIRTAILHSPLVTHVKDLSKRAIGSDAYRGDPREYDPRDPRRHDIAMRPEESHKPSRPSPPPAHSHHRSDGLYQLATAATEQRRMEPGRPHSEPHPDHRLER